MYHCLDSHGTFLNRDITYEKTEWNIGLFPTISYNTSGWYNIPWKIQHDNYYPFAKVILLNQSDNRPFMWSPVALILPKNSAIYHAVPEVHLTNNLKCSATKHLEDELSPKSHLHASKWNRSRVGQKGLAYKPSIFVLDLVNVQPNRFKGCHNTVDCF